MESTTHSLGKTPAHTRTLRAALLANASFSAVCGLLLVFKSAVVAEWLGLNFLFFLPWIGTGLLLFAADLIHQATRPRMASWRALYASAADFTWVFATAVILLFFPAFFSLSGLLTVAGVAGGVLVFASWQLWGICRLHRATLRGNFRHCMLFECSASTEQMWRVISQLDSIANYMPALASSSLRNGGTSDVGCVRECSDHSGKSWAERCTDYRENSGFEVEFLCDEPKFPFPASKMRGGWEIFSEKQESSCRVLVWWELRPKPRWLAPVLLSVLAFQADRDFPAIIQNMADDATGAIAATSPVHKIKTTLLPRLC